MSGGGGCSAQGAAGPRDLYKGTEEGRGSGAMVHSGTRALYREGARARGMYRERPDEILWSGALSTMVTPTTATTK